MRRGSEAIETLRRALEIEADLRLFGNNRKAAGSADGASA